MHDSAAADPPPRPPVEPDAADCCGEGCANCVFDVYDTALERYRIVLASWQARHLAQPDGSEVASASNAPVPKAETRPP